MKKHYKYLEFLNNGQILYKEGKDKNLTFSNTDRLYYNAPAKGTMYDLYIGILQTIPKKDLYEACLLGNTCALNIRNMIGQGILYYEEE